MLKAQSDKWHRFGNLQKGEAKSRCMFSNVLLFVLWDLLKLKLALSRLILLCYGPLWHVLDINPRIFRTDSGRAGQGFLPPRPSP